MSIFEGIWVPIVTPFRRQEVDLEAMQKLAGDLYKSSVNGIVVCGTTGEAAMLDEGEKAQILAAIQEVVPSTFPLVMGIQGSDTRSTAEKLTKLENFGQPPAAYLISAPAYVKPSQEGIRLHFEAMCAATKLPIIIYNVPSRTGVNIEFETVKALSQYGQHEQILAIKECNGKLEQTARLIKQTKLQVLCGDDVSLFDFLSIGGHGAISAAAHLRPDLFSYLRHLIIAGETSAAVLLFNQMLPMIRLLFCEPNPAPIKAALSLLGYLQEECRLPMTPMSKVGKQFLARELEVFMAIKKPEITPAKVSYAYHPALIH